MCARRQYSSEVLANKLSPDQSFPSVRVYQLESECRSCHTFHVLVVQSRHYKELFSFCNLKFFIGSQSPLTIHCVQLVLVLCKIVFSNRHSLHKLVCDCTMTLSLDMKLNILIHRTVPGHFSLNRVT